MGHTENPYRNIPYRRSAPSSPSSRFESSTSRKAWLVASVQSWNFNRQWKYKPEKLGYPICCMEYLPTFALKITQSCRKIYQHHGAYGYHHLSCLSDYHHVSCPRKLTGRRGTCSRHSSPQQSQVNHIAIEHVEHV